MLSETKEQSIRQKNKRQRTSSPPPAASKPSASSRIVSGWVEFPLESVKEHFTCSLCKGYIRCAHTISECLHSFCKSCLLRAYSRGLMKCPSCHVNLGPDPSSVTIFDRTLQELIDKLLPELNETDRMEEIQYYQRKGILPETGFAEEINREDKMTFDKRIELEDAVGEMAKAQTSPGQRSMLRRQILELACDELNVELIMEEDDEGILQGNKVSPSDMEKDDRITQLKNSCIRTSGRLKICQLKKYILSQLRLESKFLSKLTIMCKGDPVEDDCSLAFIQKTRWLVPDKDMVLTFSFKTHKK